MSSTANINTSVSPAWPRLATPQLSVASPRFWLWTLTVGLAFFVVDQDPRLLERASWDEEVYSADEFAERNSGGNVVRQAAFLSLGLLGAYGVFTGAGRQIQWRDPILLAVVGFGAWCLLSVLWSSDPGQSLRRWVVLACIYVGALGLVRQLSARDLVRMALVVTLAWLLLSFLLELALGRFQPWTANYRYSVMMHANAQAMYCGLLCLAAVAMLYDVAQRGWFICFTLLASSAALLLTRSRSALVAIVAGLIMLWLVRKSARKLPLALALLLVVSCTALVAGFVGSDAEQRITGTLLLGRAEDAASLTSRIPLWSALGDFVLKRPLTGYGYGAFWNLERSEAVADAIYARGWLIPHAHSSYFDALIGVGVVGAGALIAMLALALVRAARRYRFLPNTSHAFLFSMLIFSAVSGLAESTIIEPEFFYFLTICCVLQLTFPEGTEYALTPHSPA